MPSHPWTLIIIKRNLGCLSKSINTASESGSSLYCEGSRSPKSLYSKLYRAGFVSPKLRHFLRSVDNANHGTRNPEANFLACMHITANIIYILKFILSLASQCVLVVDGDDAHRSADLVGYFLLGRAQSRRLSLWWAGLDSNQRIPKERDLQSPPFNHLGTDPYIIIIVASFTISSKISSMIKLCRLKQHNVQNNYIYIVYVLQKQY